MAFALSFRIWMNTTALLLMVLSTTSFPLSDYGQETQEVLGDLFGDNVGDDDYQPVSLTQRDQERLGYEDWPRKEEKLSRHKYKFDDEDMYGQEYDLLHNSDPAYLKDVYKELYNLVYPAIYEEYMDTFLSGLENNQDENEKELIPLKRTAVNNALWKNYIQKEATLSGLRRRKGFGSYNQYLWNGLPLRQRSHEGKTGVWDNRRIGARINRAFAKSSGVSDKDVLNKKGVTDASLENFDWGNFQTLDKRFPKKYGYDNREDTGVPPFIPYQWEEEVWNRDPSLDVYRRDGQRDGYFVDDIDLEIPDEYLKNLPNRRAEPIWDLVGPYAGYNIYGKLLSEGKRTHYDKGQWNPIPNPDLLIDDDESNVDDDTSLDGTFVEVNEDSYEESIESDDTSIASDEQLSESDKEDTWDPLLGNNIGGIYEKLKEGEEEKEEGIDLDNDLDGVWVAPEEIPTESEDISEEEDKVEEDVADTIDTEIIKAKLRQQIMELLQKIGELRRR